MGDLDVDTTIEARADGGFTARLSPDWEIWGPNGGYLAAVALRAAGAVVERARPASINAHFVGAGRSDEVDLDVVVNRHTRVASSATVTMTQGDRPLLVATVWGVDAELGGIEHHTARGVDDVPEPEQLTTFEERLGDDLPDDRHPFWSNLELRPVEWIDDWEQREASEPLKRTWYRFQPAATFDDPWVDACRSLILIDLDSWPAACLAQVGELDHYAPTIEVTARFCADTRSSPWLLGTAAAPVATGGLVGATGEIWTPEGRLVALGGSTLLCRPAVRRPDR